MIVASSSIAAINGSRTRILLYLFLFRCPHPGQRRLRIQLFLSVNPTLNCGNRSGQSALSFGIIPILRRSGRWRRTTLSLLPLHPWGSSSLSLLPGSSSTKVDDEGGLSLFAVRLLQAAGRGQQAARHGYGNDIPDTTSSSDATRDHTIAPTTGVVPARRLLQRLQLVLLRRRTGVGFPTREGSGRRSPVSLLIVATPADWSSPELGEGKSVPLTTLPTPPKSPTSHSATAHTPTPAPMPMPVPCQRRSRPPATSPATPPATPPGT